MGLVLPPIEAYQVQPLPIVLGMILDPLSGRRPLYRLAEVFTPQDTALLLGKAVPPEAFQDATVGRGLAGLYATGTMKVCTAWAVRADRVFGFDQRSVRCDTTSITGYGDYRPLEETPEQEVPFRITYGYSKEKRPDLK
jgi:hypothetical protein